MIKLPIINRIFPSYKSKIIAVIVTGVIVGGGVLFMYMLRAHTYLGDDPAACVNCHIMSPLECFIYLLLQLTFITLDISSTEEKVNTGV